MFVDSLFISFFVYFVPCFDVIKKTLMNRVCNFFAWDYPFLDGALTSTKKFPIR